MYEAKNVYGLTLVPQKGSVEDIVSVIQKKLEGTMSQAELHLLPLFERVTKIMKFVPPTAVIKPVDDAAEVVLPKNCKLEQLAHYVDDETLIVSQEIWNALSATDKAALITHEAIYRLERTYGAKDSRRARKIVGHVFSDFAFEKVDADLPPGAKFCSAKNKGKMTYQFAYYPSSNARHTVLQFMWFEGKPVFSKKTVVLPLQLPWLKNVPASCPDGDGCNISGGDISSNFEGGVFFTVGIKRKITPRSIQEYLYIDSKSGQHILDCFPSNEGKENAVVLPYLSFPIIPATASSCINLRQAGDLDKPVVDVPASYFRIPRIQIQRNNPDTELTIAYLRAVVKSANGGNYYCKIGGDNLKALSSDWWNKQNAVIPAGVTQFDTDCAMYCGGLQVNAMSSYAGTLEVYGMELDIPTQEVRPVKLSTPFSVSSY
ncbi:hypothetical protein [Bdellovibrio bacteriovorus]|uniref:hypothetical protein n=1 Tax=Bdellovibrio bacteriovorus TaxID=959 RepID=UPI0035A62969